MLAIKNLSKIYKSKQAEPVHALDNISVSFPDTGMIFLLGKSGSGKSTMLNVIGGLDAFDKGEIIIKGKSSKSFKEKDFDSYRNTYIGFIFQDYNILEDFSVEKNIALALELQGKDASREAVDSILEQVDLKGFGRRKPNQLSGGQKQRVAIARALIKNPEIIMADEPSGALDSATGRQVFETLKKLSSSRLVIVVSHDRDFAESYADRIIELKDGKILNDTSKRKAPIENISDAVISSGSTILVKPGHKVTSHEKQFIEKALANNEHGVIISVDKEVNQNFKKFAKMDENGNREYFNNTIAEDFKSSGDKNFKLIKSRFKYWDSFKMGASGLKLKKVRLVFTLLLAAIAFTFFGVADTAGSFNVGRSMHDSLVASKAKTTAITKRVEEINSWDNSKYMRDEKVSDSDVAKLRTKFPNHAFVPVMEMQHNSVKLNYHMKDKLGSYGTYYQNVSSAYDFAPEEYLKFGLTLKGGRLPSADDEIVITDYQYDNFLDLKYINNTPGATQGITIQQIATGSNGILHSNANPRVISVSGPTGWIDLKIVGVINTSFDFDLYRNLKNATNDRSNMMKLQEVSDVLNFGFSNALYLNEGYFSRNSITETRSNVPFPFEFKTADRDWPTFNYMAKASVLEEDGIIFLEAGKTIATLAANEIIIHINSINTFFEGTGFYVNINYGYDEFNIWTEDYGQERFNNLTAYRNRLTAILLEHTDDILPLSLIEKNPRNMTVENSTPMVIAGVYYDLLTKDTDFLSNFAYDWYYEPDTFDNTAYLSNSFAGSPVLLKAMEPPPPYKMIQVSLTGKDMALVKFLTQYKDGEFIIKNQFSTFFEMFSQAVASIANVFIYVGIGFAVFAGLMMMSFITMTINHKKREIGILRAIGAKKFDVFKIFFNESLIMAVLNFIFAVIFTIVAVILLNNLIGGGLGMSVVLLSFGLRQTALIAGASLLVAILATALPVRKMSKLKPIDAIQNRK